MGVVQQTPNISKTPQCALRTVVTMGKIVEGTGAGAKASYRGCLVVELDVRVQARFPHV